MSRLKQLVERLCPDGVEYKALGDCLSPKKNSMVDGPFGSNLKKEHYTDRHEVRVVQLSNIGEGGWIGDNERYTSFEHLKTISRHEAFPGDIVIAKMFPAGRAIILPDLGVKYVLSSDAIRFVPSDVLDKKYAYYAINGSDFRRQVARDTQGATRPRTGIPKLKRNIIPVPPLEVQREVVRILDSFQELDDALTAEIDAREKQLKSMLTKLDLTPERSSYSKPLKDCCQMGRGTYITKKEVSEGNVPVVMGGLEPAYYHSVSNHTGEGIVISRSGVNAGFSSFWNQPIFVSDGFVADSNGKDILKFVYYALRARQRNVDMLRRGSGVPHVNGKMLGELPLYMPSVDEQLNWVRKLDAISDLISDIKLERDARRRQFAFYRDKLLSFPERKA